MKIKLQTILAVGVILFVTLGCNQIKKAIEASRAPKVITAADNKCQLTVPGNWQTRTDLHEEANWQAANLFAEQYAIVISESKADLSADILLQDYTDLLQGSTKQKVADVTFSPVKNIDINGYPAAQYEAEGTVEKIRIKWIFTIIDTPKYMHQIVAWTTPSNYNENRQTLLDVINSFKDLTVTESPKLPVKSSSPTKK